MAERLILPPRTRYVCSLLQGGWSSVCLSSGEAEEAALTLMQVTGAQGEARFVFRVTQEGNQVYVPLASFAADAAQICSLLMLSRQLFVLRGVYARSAVSGAPLLLRVYCKETMLTTCAASNLTSRVALDNERALTALLQAAMGRVIVEPPELVAAAGNSLLAQQSTAPPLPPRAPSGCRFLIPARRNLAPEQRCAAQRALHVTFTSAARASVDVREAIGLTDGVCVDTRTWRCERTEVEARVRRAPWVPSGGFLVGARGSGRRRVVAAVTDAVVSGAMDAGSLHAERVASLALFAAPRTALIVCAPSALDAWQAELVDQPALLVRAPHDLERLTYRAAREGRVVVITPAMLSAACDAERATLEDMAAVAAAAQARSSAPTFDGCRRLHAGSLAQRFPDAAVPLHWLQARVVFIDDGVLELAGVEQQAEREAAVRDAVTRVARLATDFSWVCVATHDAPPTHCPPAWMLLCAELLGLASHSLGDGHNKQVHPSAWRAFHEPVRGLFQRARTPRVILRKVTPIPVSVRPTADELAFLARIQQLQQSMTAVPVPPLHDAHAALLGAEVAGAPACRLDLALRREQPMTLADAADSLAAHFSREPKGTLAQRVGIAFAAKMRLGAVVGEESLADRSFVQRALSEALDGACQVCLTDPVARVTLCGHAFCDACAGMLRRDEPHAGLTRCPCCRASLCTYDWLQLAVSPPPLAAPQPPSKVLALRNALASVFSRRRAKRRCPLAAWVVVPAQAAEVVAAQLRDAYDVTVVQHALAEFDAPQTDEQQRCNVHRVLVMTFAQLEARCAAARDDDAIAAVVLTEPASPAQHHLYSLLVRHSARRESALPLHIVFTMDVEDAALERALRAFQLHADDPVRRVMREAAP
jgi:hypothetical protein